MKHNKSSVGLTGLYFHAISLETHELETCGHVTANPEPGWYLVEYFKWLSDSAGEKHLITVEEMRMWRFYDSLEAMHDALEEAKTAPFNGKTSPIKETNYRSAELFAKTM